ncbi:MAG: hypothetical protein IJZ34_10385 [Lachnospiraceae bacterium]|nr:hypothetical protein [Lachnospiraceae bacterium]
MIKVSWKDYPKSSRTYRIKFSVMDELTDITVDGQTWDRLQVWNHFASDEPEEAHPATKASDNDTQAESRWAASGEQWICLDLGTKKEFSALGLTWWNGSSVNSWNSITEFAVLAKETDSQLSDEGVTTVPTISGEDSNDETIEHGNHESSSYVPQTPGVDDSDEPTKNNNIDTDSTVPSSPSEDDSEETTTGNSSKSDPTVSSTPETEDNEESMDNESSESDLTVSPISDDYFEERF